MSAVLLGLLTIGARYDARWETFLSSPDEAKFAVLERAIGADINECRLGDPYNQDVVPTTKQERQLFELIRAGNVSAFRAGLLIERCWDGGDLEDFYRSSGVFFESQPRAFLQIATEKVIPDSTLESLLTMLPLDTVDDIDRKLYVIDARIDLITAVREQSLETVKAKSLCFLKEYKEQLKKTKAEIERSKKK